MSKSNQYKILEIKEGKLKVEWGSQILQGFYYPTKDFIDIHLPLGDFRSPLHAPKKRQSSQHSHPEEELQAPMPGKIIQLLVKEGQKVKKGDLLLILEAMKMEHKIISHQNGIIQKIFFKEGERVSQGQELISME